MHTHISALQLLLTGLMAMVFLGSTRLAALSSAARGNKWAQAWLLLY